MRDLFTKLLLIALIFTVSFSVYAQNSSSSIMVKKKVTKKYRLPKIDLSHWSVTVPAEGKDGKPVTVGSPAILDYGDNTELKPYMYNDSIKGALVFFAYPTNATTANTKYSRSELREQMKPGDNNVNWTFAQGGTMKGKLQMGEVSKEKDGKYSKVIIMQIHGRLTNEQKQLIGQKDNNAPPILKIYWQDGKIRVKTKVLKNPSATGKDLLYTDAWGDDKGFNFKEEVGFNKFTLEVRVSRGKMVIVLNNNEFKVYEDSNIQKWGIFENYFKAGNYFQSRTDGTFAKVNYYELTVSH